MHQFVMQEPRKVLAVVAVAVVKYDDDADAALL
jgi:hypothetical protein